jgi:hypothetical protein
MATTLTFGPFQLDGDAGILFHNAKPTALGRAPLRFSRCL